MKTNNCFEYNDDILKHLKHINAIPKAIRNIDFNLNAIKQALARAGDEIEKLREKNKIPKYKINNQKIK